MISDSELLKFGKLKEIEFNKILNICSLKAKFESKILVKIKIVV